MKTLDFSQLKTKSKYYDKVFWFIMIALCVVSMLAMYSAGSQLVHRAIARGNSHFTPFYSHVAFLLGGLLFAFVIQQFSSKLIRILSYLLLGFSIICLFLVFVPGLGVEVNGARRWLRLGFTFQPSEFAKLSLIVVEADLLSRMNGKSKEERRKIFLLAFSLMVLVCGLIMVYNLSTAVLLAAVCFALMFVARVDWKVLIGIIGIGVIVLIGGYLIVENVYIKKDRQMTGLFRRSITWVNRVDNMLDKQEQEPDQLTLTDANRQEIYAQLAVARGGKTPMGVGPGNSLERDYLPLAYADYIFSIFVEEWGAIGALVLMALYLTLLFRACTSSNRFEDNAAMIMVMGLGMMLTMQAFVSMAVAVGLGPVTGQQLPLISRGGTGILLVSAYFGIMMAVSREQNELKAASSQAAAESMEEEPELI